MTIALPLIDEPKQTRSRILGCLEVQTKNKRLKLPLKGVEIEANVADRLAYVTMTETFQNPHSEHLEAVYIFPLSGGCAVSSFKMKVADRIIEGAVNEREKARAEYAEAIEDGKRAALLEQERDDVFTVQVGNLPPGEEITVILAYSEKLAYFENGTTEIRLPLVVSQRYIPGQAAERDNVGDGVEQDTDQVPDASRITPPRLAPGVDPKVALKLSVVLAGGQMVEDLSCSQHATKLGVSQDGITVSLSQETELLNRDFVLRWRLAGDEMRSNFLVFPAKKDKKQPEGGCAASDCAVSYAMLSLIPPRSIDIATAPRDVIFVLDRSGSMAGIKMTSAARACSYILSTLGPNDRFAIQAFDTVVEWMNPANSSPSSAGHFVKADVAGVEEGAKYLRTIDARGGTEISGAIDSAISEMNSRKKATGRQPVIVVLTDGAIGNESAVLKLIQSKLRDIRVFTVGIDTAVNEGFLRRLASLGGGTASFVEPTTAIEAALEQVSREIGTPLIQNLSLEDMGCGLDLDSMAPNRMPDIFEGRAVTTFFQLSEAALQTSSTIKVKGTYPDGTPFSMVVSPAKTDIAALPQLWAKEHITDLEDAYRTANGEEQKSLREKIVAIAIEHGLLTKFTAFVVVDHSEVVNKDGQVRKIVQPVHEAALWEMNQRVGVMSAGAAGAWGAAMPSQGLTGAHALPQAHFAQNAPAPAGAPMNLAQSIVRAKKASADREAGSGERFGSPGSSAGWGSPPMNSIGKASKDQTSPTGWQPAPPQVPGAAPAPSTPVREEPGSPPPCPAPPEQASDAACATSMTVTDLLRKKLQEGLDNLQKMPRSVTGGRAETMPGAGGAAGGTRSDTSFSGVASKPDERLSKVREAFEALIHALDQAFDQIKNAALPKADELEKKRQELIDRLSGYENASELPVLQKYLRSDLIKLIAALNGAQSVNDKLKEIVKAQENVLQQARDEMSSHTNVPSQQPFWHSAI